MLLEQPEDVAYSLGGYLYKSAKPNQYMHGTGIGVKNIDTMMVQMNGRCAVHAEPDSYSITLSFPIVHPKTG